jgi:hypothetical protein
MRRAVLESKAALEALGHTLIEISPPDSYDTFWATWGILKARYNDQSKGERPIPDYKWFMRSVLTPLWLKPFFARRGDANGQKQDTWTIVCKAHTLTTAYDYAKFYQIVVAFREKFFEEWSKHKLDACVWPTPTPILND